VARKIVSQRGEQQQQWGGVEFTSDKGGSNPELSNGNPGEKEDWQEQQPTQMDVNMVFTIPTELCALAEDVAELTLGVGRVVFKKPKNPGAHMNPLFIRGHLDVTPIGHMLVDGGACINILPLSVFKKFGYVEGDLKHTNLSLSGFVVDPTEAKGLFWKKLTIGSKNVPMAFFVVDVMGRYNML
jgi:hypothetical protein